MIENKWDKKDYQKIQKATVDDDKLIVEFMDNSFARVSIASLVPLFDGSKKEIELEYDAFEVSLVINGQKFEIPWTKIRLLSDSDFASYWIKKEEEESREIGIRIREIRKRKNLSSKLVALRANISPQSYSRIEHGGHDISYSTLTRILAAMGSSLEELSQTKLASTSMREFLNYLNRNGLSKNLVEHRILPDYLDEMDKNSSVIDLSGFIKKASERLGKIFNISPGLINAQNNFLIEDGALQPALYKKPSSYKERTITAYSLYAHYLAILILHSIKNTQYTPLLQNGNLLRHAIINSSGTLNLESTIRFLWNSGIPIIPLFDPGEFHGACFYISGRPVIVLKQNTNYQARWLFDLLHEVGHAALHLHTLENSIIENGEITPFDNSNYEQEANDFASAVLFESRINEITRMCIDESKGKIEYLKSALIQVSANENVPVDSLANYLAYRLNKENNINWWGTANKLQISEPSPDLITKSLLLRNIDKNRMSAEDFSLLKFSLERN